MMKIPPCLSMNFTHSSQTQNFHLSLIIYLILIVILIPVLHSCFRLLIQVLIQKPFLNLKYLNFHFLYKDFDLTIGKDGWWKDCITAAEIKNNKCYLLTYNRIIIYTIHKGKFTFSHSISLDTVSQYESMAINSKGIIYIADEKNKLLGGGYLYTVAEPQQKKK